MRRTGLRSPKWAQYLAPWCTAVPAKLTERFRHSPCDSPAADEVRRGNCSSVRLLLLRDESFFLRRTPLPAPAVSRKGLPIYNRQNTNRLYNEQSRPRTEDPLIPPLGVGQSRRKPWPPIGYRRRRATWGPGQRWCQIRHLVPYVAAPTFALSALQQPRAFAIYERVAPLFGFVTLVLSLAFKGDLTSSPQR